ncbi:hypothetical protein [Dyadobacter psychrophilus]|uniref:Abortive infection C-terminus n=1 Tax=Dyadobacter psychrophilus TaxID=651661 RepID=A0A1T5DDJ8_9BACT|nr:hypothetical protein [Dyadobacter psychrophilus]SKB69691.1 hypothetical protein SAMN05660293_01543 [Dyadobacter psychrophilus]
MLDDKNELRRIISTVTQLFQANQDDTLADLLRVSEITSEISHYDNWNAGITYYSVYINTPVDTFIKIQNRQSEIESAISEKIELVMRPYDDHRLGTVYVIPISISKIEWERIADISTKEQLIADVNFLHDTMISVSTGGSRIQDVNDIYQEKFAKVELALKRLSLDNPNPFSDLWRWYAKWSAGEMPQYKDRRTFIREMYGEFLKNLQSADHHQLLNVSVNLTGWERIGRTVRDFRSKLSQATTEEQFQTIGLLCRETIISLAQAVYIEEKHPTLDGIKASKTDAKRMLDAYIAAELGGSSNENLRKYARASNDLANELTHKRTANKQDASLCASATISLVNAIGILEKRH